MSIVYRIIRRLGGDTIETATKDYLLYEYEVVFGDGTIRTFEANGHYKRHGLVTLYKIVGPPPFIWSFGKFATAEREKVVELGEFQTLNKKEIGETVITMQYDKADRQVIDGHVWDKQ